MLELGILKLESWTIQDSDAISQGSIGWDFVVDDDYEGGNPVIVVCTLQYGNLNRS